MAVRSCLCPPRAHCGLSDEEAIGLCWAEGVIPARCATKRLIPHCLCHGKWPVWCLLPPSPCRIPSEARRREMERASWDGEEERGKASTKQRGGWPGEVEHSWKGEEWPHRWGGGTGKDWDLSGPGERGDWDCIREWPGQRHLHKEKPREKELGWMAWDGREEKVDMVEVGRLGRRKKPHLLQKSAVAGWTRCWTGNWKLITRLKQVTIFLKGPIHQRDPVSCLTCYLNQT